MNWRALCLELADRLAEHVPADDPLLIYARQGLVKRTPQPFGRGEKNIAAVLTPEKVRELRRLRAEGMSYGKLAIRYGISKHHAARICARRQWAWVND